MQIIADVSSEGGPLIIGTASIIKQWKGYEGNPGDDYSRASAVFDGNPSVEGGVIAVGSGECLLWEMQGGGIASVFLSSNGSLVIVRPWLNSTDTEDDDCLSAAQEPITEGRELGQLTLVAGDALTIMWAAESGLGFSDEDFSQTGNPDADLAVPGSALVVLTQQHMFTAIHDRVRGDWGEARRCHLVPIGSPA